ncbi:MAG: HNH endonuclease, partial [Erysipelotrichaceae bacterium]|nr:HNH endonuclease [Erysipelotrichaceae bacterium]
MVLPYSNEINIQLLGRLFDNTSECYKFFWFKAILSKVSLGQQTMSYEELVDEMIVDAWYMVTEYHLNLGPSDTLEKVIKLINDKYPLLKSNEKRESLLTFLKNTEDKDIRRMKMTLTKNVPYRLQAPFLSFK